MRANKSVVDFDTDDALRKALMAVRLPDDPGEQCAVPSASSKEEKPVAMELDTRDVDWIHISTLDPETEVHTMKQELHRLQVLKSYMILGAEKEEAFERLTRLASRYFKVPVALVSLVDLSRMWFMSNHGLGDVREVPRNRHSVCAHAILNKGKILIVPDTTKDFRFRDSGIVTGPPSVRFYAGASLISPEGYKLGTFCVIDSKPRPEGLNEEEQNTLRDFAAMTVKEMVERRKNLKSQQSPAQLIAYTAHDLMTPLTGVQLSLSLLKGDDDVMERLAPNQQELLSTASNCSDLMIRICQTAIETLRNDSATIPEVSSVTKQSNTPVTKMSDLLKNLKMIMEPFPKRVPLVVTLDPNVPPTIVSDDLKLFRSALNLISNGIGRTSLGVVRFRIYAKTDTEEPKLFFECEDTGDEIQVEEYQYLFHPSRTRDGELRLGLSSVATLINSLDGEYGFRPAGSDVRDPSATKQRGAMFWFSVPLFTPENFGVDSDDQTPTSVLQKSCSNTTIPTNGTMKQPIIPVMPKNSSSTGMSADAILRRTTSSLGIAGRGPDILRHTAPNPIFPSQLRRTTSSVGIPGRTGTSHSNALFGNRNGGFGVGSRDSFMYNLGSAPQGGIPAVVGTVQGKTTSNLPTNHNVPKVAIPSSVSISKVTTSCPPAAAAPKIARKRCALIIEDSLVVRKSIARALEKLGLNVTQAVNGLEGLKSMKAKLFDFVLCDFLMPVMDGLDCVKQYRDWEKQNRQHIKQYIVGISAHAGANDGNKGINAGMNDFKPKPVSIKILTEIKGRKEVTDLNKQLDEIEQTNAGLDSGSSSSLSGMIPGPPVFRKSLSMHSMPGMARSASMLNGKRTAAAAVAPAGESLSSQRNFSFDLMNQQQSMKRQKIDCGFSCSTAQGSSVCLLATSNPPTQDSNDYLAKMQQKGWQAVLVHDGREALRLLKMRNWNAVLIEDDIPVMSASDCIKQFRNWEQQNRVNRQRNLYVVCTSFGGQQLPSIFDKHSVVQPPSGFDGALGHPVEWQELNHMLGLKKERSLDIIVGGGLM